MSKPSLLELQRWLAWKVAGAKGPEPQPSCAPFVLDQAPVSRDERLEIYSHAFLARIVENLQADFEAVARLAGHERFWRLVDDYITAFPSNSASVNDLGKNFPAFLLLNEISGELPFLHELATFEWSLCEALHTNPPPVAPPQDLSEIPESVWLNARAEIDPSVRLFNFEWPVHEIWKGSTGTESRRSYVLVFRDGDKARFENLTKGEFALLRLLQNGASIEAALEQSGLEDAKTVNEAFARWMKYRVLNRFDFSTEGCD
ncbi:MAG TPA: DNA-binding domain-containing protein [Bdellovibrionales bacterium]|nr:DNA-binding domain-containing protein [Bdellovibrionales bacterium]